MLALAAGWALLSLAGTTAVLAVLLVGLRVPARPDRRHLLDAARPVAPAGTVTEAFTVMVMGIVAGTAVGNALGGAIVDGASYEAGALTAAGDRRARAPAVAAARRQTLAA